MKRSLFRTRLFIICAAALLVGCSKPDDDKKADTKEGSVKEETAKDNADGKAADDKTTDDKAKNGEYTFKENEDGTITLTGYTGKDSTLYIPDKINGKTVTAIGESCFAGKLCLNTVHIPEGVADVGNYAFECCNCLRKVYFPDSLKSIGDGAFSGCQELFLVDMQDGIESIGKGAFLYCGSLVQLELPKELGSIGDFAFANCSVLSSVIFNGDSIKAIPDRLFYGCTSMFRIKLPESIDSVGKRAFSGCENLSSLYFANELKDLGESAFENCSKLSSITVRSGVITKEMFRGCNSLEWFSVPEETTYIEYGAFAGSGVKDITLPASVKEIEPGAFYEVYGSVSLDEENKDYCLKDGSLYTADGKTLLAFFPQDPYAEEPQTEFVIPEGVEAIASYALAQSRLTKVTLPASLKQIDAYAFEGLELDDLKIADSVKVDPNAFGAPESEYEEEQQDTEMSAPETIGSISGDKNLFDEKKYADFHEISNDGFEEWCNKYIEYNSRNDNQLSIDTIPYTILYKGEVQPHYIPMAAVQNHDPDMWAESVEAFGDDFEQMYLMIDHGLSTELKRGRMEDSLILYSGLYDSQLMAAAGTDTVPTQQQLVDSIGKEFTDPIMISTTTDPGIAAGFGDTLFIIYASPKAMEKLGAVCIDAVAHSSEKEILMNDHARYRILDVGNMSIEKKEEWETESTTLYRNYVKVELLE